MLDEARPLGQSGLAIGPLGLGCWPLAGMTREGVSRSDAEATVAAAVDCGILHLDTAYCYGAEGESERAIAAAIGDSRERVFIAGKCGIHWAPGRTQVVDGRPERLRREVEESLARLGTDHLDLIYLHAPDPRVPIEQSMGELARIHGEGLARSVGVSNVGLDQLRRAAGAAPLAAVQLPYNMLQRGIEVEIIPWCLRERVAVIAYWPLMKGLLAGAMGRDRTFPASDSRHKYPMFNGEEFQRNLDFVDVLRAESSRLGHPVADVVLAWTIEQTGITGVLVGATTPEQVRSNAAALRCRLDARARDAIRAGIEARGPVAGRRAV